MAHPTNNLYTTHILLDKQAGKWAGWGVDR